MEKNRTLIALAVGVFGITTTEFGVIGILPDLAAYFNVTIDTAGLMLSAFAIVVAFSGPFMVQWLSSYNRKNLMIFSLVIFVVSNLLSVISEHFYVLVFVRMVPAFFHPVYWSIALSIAARQSTHGDSSKSVSMVFSGLTIATVLGVPMATYISDLFGWQASFLLSALINLVSVLGLWFFMPPIEAEKKVAQKRDLGILKNNVLWVNFLITFLIITAMYSTYAYMAEFLGSVSKMDGTDISLMLLVFGAMGIYGNRLAGKYMGKYPKKATVLFIVLLISVHLLVYWFGMYYWLIVLITAIWGLIHTGGFVIGNLNLTSSISGTSELINSLFTSCGNLAVTIGTLLGGFWIASYGVHNVIWSSIVCLLMCLFTIFMKVKFVKEMRV